MQGRSVFSKWRVAPKSALGIGGFDRGFISSMQHTDSCIGTSLSCSSLGLSARLPDPAALRSSCIKWVANHVGRC